MLQQLDQMLPDVSLQEITAVVTAYRSGVARRNLCAHLHMGGGRYKTVIKPVVDLYEQLQQQTA